MMVVGISSVNATETAMGIIWYDKKTLKQGEVSDIIITKEHQTNWKKVDLR